ncbi:MAG TPA: hypothetical protein VME43_25785 [Bryobacteraceae bacterium]|nr:hypothetical protein [Bryobacteraceae bacterium]
MSCWIAGCLAAATPLLRAQTLAVAPSTEIPPPQMAETLQAMPLLEAHQYLLWARSEVMEEDYTGADAALLTVAQALAVFEIQEPGPHGLDADFTRQRIEEYTRVLASDPSDAVSRIDSWMDRIGHWGGGK